MGDLGVYAKPNDYHSLANSIVELLCDERLREELSRKVRDKAVENYSWNKVGERIIKVYAKLAA